MHGAIYTLDRTHTADQITLGGAHPVPYEDDDVLRPLACWLDSLCLTRPGQCQGGDQRR